MLDENDRHEAAGTWTYNSEWNSLELDGYELHCGESMEVSVFGYWIPGQLALDTAGWYLLTLDQGASSSDGLLHDFVSRHAVLFLLSCIHHRCTPRTSSLLTTIRRCCKPSPTPYLYVYPKRRWIPPTRLKERSS